MSKQGKPVFVVPTAYPKTPQVTLFYERWKHIAEDHPEIDQQSVLSATANVSVVLPGKYPNTVMFINPQVTTPGGTPLGVIVHEEEASIVTAYYNRSMRIIPTGQALWLLQKK